MPIIESPSLGSPLSQGDILKGIHVFETKVTATGTEAFKSKGLLCLVLSRPCVAAHKSHIVVAEIHKYPLNLPKEIESFEDCLAFLTDTRDGNSSPDVFYLGHLPQIEGRFYARLDRLHTLNLAFEKHGEFWRNTGSRH
jgi:hypothetical protein